MLGDRRRRVAVSLPLWLWMILGTLAIFAFAGTIMSIVALAKGPKRSKPGPPGSPAPHPTPPPGDCDLYGDKICSDELHTELLNATTILTQTICNDVLAHTESAVLPPTHRFQTLQGQGDPLVVPSPSFPVVPFPLDEFAFDQEFPIGVPAETTDGLVFTPFGSGPVFIANLSGDKILQLGAEEVFSASSLNDLQPPRDGQNVGVVISFNPDALPFGAPAVRINVRARWSSEAGFDYVSFSGATSGSAAGFGTPSDPYLEADLGSITFLAGLQLTVTYAKDSNTYSGVDAVQLVITDFEPVAVPPPAPLAPVGLNMQLPSDLTDYVGKDIILCANDENGHVVNLTDTGLSFDQAGEYTEMVFINGGSCCVTLAVSSPTRLSVQTSHSQCVHFCKPFLQACTTSFNKLSDTNVVLELDNGVFPSTHSLVHLTGPAQSVQLIPCDKIADYVGRRYTVVNEGRGPQRLIIAGDSSCGAHFQLGDPLEGRQRGSTIILDGDKGSVLEFVVINEELISVTTNRNVRVCDIDGNCAPVGEMLNAFNGWWAIDNSQELSFNSVPDDTLIHIEAAAYEQGRNRLILETFSGPPRHPHTTVPNYTPNLADYTLRSTLPFAIIAPFEGVIGTGDAPFIQAAQVDPTNTSFLYFQNYPFGAGPWPAFIGNYWDPRYTTFDPYVVYRRISAPYGSGTSERSGPRTTPSSPEFLQHVGPGVHQQHPGGLTDRTLMFEYYADMQINVYNPVFGEEPDQRCDGVESRMYAVDLAKRIVDGETFVREANLVRAQITNTPRNVTLIEAATYPSVNGFSNVTFFDVTGPLSGRLNNKTFRTSILANGVKRHLPGTIDGESDDPSQRSLHYYFEIDLDTSDISADPVTGFIPLDGKMRVVHGPLTPNAEYKPFMDMIFFFDREVFIESTHHFMRIIPYGGEADPARSCRFAAETWAQVQDDITNNPFGIHGFGGLSQPYTYDILMWQRVNNEDVSSRYTNAWLRRFGGLGNFDLDNSPQTKCLLNGQNLGYDELENDPSGELVAPVYTQIQTGADRANYSLDRHIPFQNYCKNGTWKVFYWRTNGAPGSDPVGDPFGFEGAASFLYPPFDGSTGGELVGEIYDSDELPCVNCNFLSSNIPLGGPCSSSLSCTNNQNICNDGLCETYYEFIRDTNPNVWRQWLIHSGCCMIDPDLIEGDKIGYCNFADTTQGDPNQLMTARMFAPNSTGSFGNPRGRREATSAMYAPMYQWMFGEENAQEVIYDVRGNNGGDFIGQLTVAEFHGTERNRAFANQYVPRGAEKRPRLDYRHLFDPYNLVGNDDAPGLLMDQGVYRQYPEINEANYPGSTNLGAGAWLLSNWRSTSGGDLFLQAFAGDNLDGDLGGGTFSVVAGNPVGTLFGCFGGAGVPLPMSPEHYLLKAPDGSPISPLYMSLDRICAAAAYPDRTTPTCARSRHSFPIPLVGAPGKSGSNAPPHDTETLWHQDIGYVPNTRPRLPGDTRPQTPVWPPTSEADMFLRRDWWLEALIQTIRQPSKKRKRSAQDKAAYDARVQEHRERMANTAGTNTHATGLPLCGEDEVDRASIPKVKVARVVYDHRSMYNPEAYKTYAEINGTRVSFEQVVRELSHKTGQLKAQSAICRHADGTIGFTAQATELPVVEYTEI